MRLAITPRFFDDDSEQLISIERKYYPFFQKYGHNIHLIPFMGMDIGQYFEDLNPDGVVFAGGYRMYTGEIMEFESRVLKETLDRNLPLLAICCGMWTVNYYFSGTLKFDESHQAFDGRRIRPGKLIHPVIATDLIERKTYKVNTFHSKVVDKTGEGLNEFLVAHDDTVEGVYNLDRKIIGVQFHMENKGVSDQLTDQIMLKFQELTTA